MWRISFIILLFTHICTFAPAHAGAQVHNGETQYLSRPLSGSKSSSSKKQGGLNLRLHSSAPRTSLLLSPMKRKLEWEATCNHVDSLVANGEMRPNEWLNLYFKILSDTVALGFDTQPMLERIALNYDSLMQSNPPQLTDDLNFAAYKTGVKNTFGMIRPSSILFEMASRRYCEDIDLDLTINPSLMKELLQTIRKYGFYPGPVLQGLYAYLVKDYDIATYIFQLFYDSITNVEHPAEGQDYQQWVKNLAANHKSQVGMLERILREAGRTEELEALLADQLYRDIMAGEFTYYYPLDIDVPWRVKKTPESTDASAGGAEEENQEENSGQKQ